MSPPYERERACALDAIRQAAALCRTVRGGLDPEVLAKADRSPVTLADFGSQALVSRALEQAFPADPLIAEEDARELRQPGNERLLAELERTVRVHWPEADTEAICRAIDRGGVPVSRDRFWTLDPIDGTKGFLRNEQYAVALALIIAGRVEVAALACPNLLSRLSGRAEAGSGAPHGGTVFVAVRGQGAFAAPLDGMGSETRIQVSPGTDLAAARFCESVESGHSAHGESAGVAARLGIVAAPLRLDSQAKYAVVARGEAEAYLRLPTRADYREKIWDHAAGALMVEEAGGTVTDIHGRLLDFTQGRELSANRGVIVSNGRLHDRLLGALV